MFYSEPIFFEKNRVRRIYTGGALFADFFGDDSRDGFYPEEWVASCVHALNEGSVDQKEGISKIQGTELYFDRALEQYKKEILGEAEGLGVLTKLLDSSIRLPVQAHPDRDFAMKNFNSRYGKQESWLILGKREGARIFYGFKEGVTRDDLARAVELSETDRNAMSDLLESYEVNVGDVIFIPAGIAHAIGSGCLLLEVQEPTDFTIQPERYCGSYRLSDREMYLGLNKDTALDCFHMGLRYELPLKPIVEANENGVKRETLIGEAQTDLFRVERYTLTEGSLCLDRAVGVYVVLEGEGEITSEGYSRRLKQGDYFLLPAMAKGKFALRSDKMSLVLAYGC